MAKPNPARIRRAFGEVLCELRWRRGLAQEDVAFDMAMDRAYMSGLERGKHMPSLETLDRVCRYYDISLAQLGALIDARILRRKRP